MAQPRFRSPDPGEQQNLDAVRLRLLDPADGPERARFRSLMEQHHYLGSDIMVGEQLRYVAEIDGRWVVQNYQTPIVFACAGAAALASPHATSHAGAENLAAGPHSL